MYNNKILNFQESTTILNGCKKKSGKLLKVQRNYIKVKIDNMQKNNKYREKEFSKLTG